VTRLVSPVSSVRAFAKNTTEVAAPSQDARGRVQTDARCRRNLSSTSTRRGTSECSRIKCTLAGGLRERSMRPRREENRVTTRSRGTTCSCAAEEGGQGRLITVAFCGFVARHDPRAFRGHHCSTPNRSGNGVGQSYAVGEFPSYVKPVRANPCMCIL